MAEALRDEDVHEMALSLFGDVKAELYPAHPLIENDGYRSLTEPGLAIVQGLIDSAEVDNSIPVGWFEYVASGQLNPGDPTEGLVGVYFKVWPMAPDLPVVKYRSFPMLKTLPMWPNWTLAEFGDARPVDHYFSAGLASELNLKTLINAILEVAYSRFRPNLPPLRVPRPVKDVATGFTGL